MSISDRPTRSVENYLKTIFLLTERSEGPVSVSALAGRLRVSSSSISGMVRRLTESGLVAHVRYADIGLTPAGRASALSVVRRHRLMEMFLVVEFGFSWDEVHDEAEALEHAVSDRLLNRIEHRLGYPRFDPHGDPIPSRDGLLPPLSARRLSELSRGDSGDLVRVDDTYPDVLRYLSTNDVRLGDGVELLTRRPFDGPFVVRLARSGDEQEWGPSLARAVWISD